MAGFDFDARKHIALWRPNNVHPAFFMEKDELKVREFLVAMRLPLKKLGEYAGKAFLKNFVRSNNITWDESQEILYGNSSLQ